MMNSLNSDESKVINLKNYFREDFVFIENTFREKLQNQDIILIGAAGSIGSAILPLILGIIPKNLLLLDHDENRLTNLLRLARAKEWISPHTKISVAAMDFGSTEAKQLLAHYSKNPIVLNFAAAKHVRSERDVYGIAHLLNENFIKPWQLIEDLNPRYYFGVSTDKAANPVNFMGASKALHEKLLMYVNSSSTRFANVAFSQGSLLESWQYRLGWNEPLVAPSDIKRFLISHQDAAHLCAISISIANNSGILIPRENVVESFLLHEIAMRYLKGKNLKPVVFEDYHEAQQMLNSRNDESNEWPIVVTKSNTDGEKKFEEFVGRGENSSAITTHTCQVTPLPCKTEELLEIKNFVRHELFNLQNDWREKLIQLVSRVIPSFDPVSGLEKLDNRP
jgi:FlaA1/EpsC-like NDP-sugar epimerase